MIGNICYIRFVVLYCLLCFALGCKKAPESPEQKAIQMHDDQVRSQKQSKELIDKGKIEYEIMAQAPGGASAMDAMEYLMQLGMKGKLPGFPNNKIYHCPVRVESTSTNYPLTVTIGWFLRTNNIINHYTLTKDSTNTSWQLRKSWHSDPNGSNLGDY